MDGSGICALCRKNEANKTNTHYFTDFLIKQALNEDGTNQRDKTTSYLISDISIENNFKGSSPEKINSLLGREATDKEIENWQNTLVCSVDNVFCKDCENSFTEIENKFNSKILSKLRPTFKDKGIDDKLDDVTRGKTSLKFSEEDTILIHLFFYIQIWRSHICEYFFRILNESEIERLRTIILNYQNIKIEDLSSIPLGVNYLITPSRKEYTRNVVTKLNNSLVLNDFLIEKSYKNVAEFEINIISIGERNCLLKKIANSYASLFIKARVEYFTEEWNKFFGFRPDSILIKTYMESYFNYMDRIPEGSKHSTEETIRHLFLFIKEIVTKIS